jgi:sugar transferase (PEP-CTERM system associated)
MLKIGGQRVPPKTLLLLASDLALILLGLLIAIALRFQDWRAVSLYLQARETLFRFVWVVAACGLSMYYYDLYDAQVVARRAELFVRLLQSLGTACLALSIVFYIDPVDSLGRGIAALAAPTSLLLLLAWRLFLDHTGLLFFKSERVLVVGTSPVGVSLVRDIISRPELHLKVVGFLDEKGERIGMSLVNPGIIGAVSEVKEIAAQQKVDRVVLSLMERRGITPVRELLDLKFAGVAVEDVHTVCERLSGRISLGHLRPSWLILSEGFRKSPPEMFLKRAFDLIISLIAIALTLPLMALVAVAIWIESGTPVIFRQERTGLAGRPFNILKFRSMYQNAEAGGPVWAADDDCRITRVGQFIRKYRFDELPQLINILRGEMSLVGPRPERPVFCRMLEEKIPLFAQRYSVRPGLTGWAQIKYQYGSTIEQNMTKLEYDLFYIKYMSSFLDLAILFETAKVVLARRGAK